MQTSQHSELEKCSSAVTLSDMEMFIFPDLMYALMLANIMSPILWRWREDPWFRDFTKGGIVPRVNRLKQYIMDHYAFNLDLSTWGLTTREREINRFRDFISPEELAQSNALFGYEGDKYYFDIDIRRHFGLDKYTDETIPYWKTETVEVMTAFSLREGYSTGAGECVSLAALYGAALFIVLGVPLSKIFLMATPLHSQNLIDISTGILTNNRRIVTKNMWFNGTALSAQARRALEHERVTLVAHETGVIHILDPEATIDPAAYERFSTVLRSFLTAELTPEILGNFLRQAPEIHRHFAIRHTIGGTPRYIDLEKAFTYEHDSPFKATDVTREKLFAGIEQSEFYPVPCDCRIVLNDLEDFLRTRRTPLDRLADLRPFLEGRGSVCPDEFLSKLEAFCRIHPRIPSAAAKRFVSNGEPLNITPDMTREQIIARIDALRGRNRYCTYAFHAFRDLSRAEPEPFLHAALERSPVSITEAAARFPATPEGDAALIQEVTGFRPDSIYEGETRLAQPDEVWNFRSGDGIERLILLANLFRARHPETPGPFRITQRGETATLTRGGQPLATLPSAKRVSLPAF